MDGWPPGGGRYLCGMKKILITGANKSIGLETARQLLALGHYVYLGCRTLANGQHAVAQLHADGLTQVEPLELDVADAASVAAARLALGRRTAVLDVLVNNAGISGGMPQTALTAALATFRRVYETNVFGVVAVTQAFIDLLRQSAAPRIVNVSSSQGSLTLASDPASKYYHHKGAVYQSSKSALNMYTIALAYELRDTPFKVNAVDPGFVATDFNHHRGTGTVQEAGTRIAKYALLADDGPTGGFFSEETTPGTGAIAW